MKGLTDNFQITAVLCGTIKGKFLPVQLIYGGKTDYTDSLVIGILHTHNHWSNENAMLMYIEEIIVSYVDQVREYLSVDESKKRQHEVTLLDWMDQAL